MSGEQQQQQGAAQAQAEQQQEGSELQQRMMLIQVSEKDWAVVTLDASGQVRELPIDEATAQQVQAGTLTPEKLAALLAAQQQGGSGGGGGEEAS
ncbi:hypothetical protein C2E21_4695 [Chlorella sorokiniana]|uniref:Uncharacterized protein n=1 Tax=Chlorella sorokiniana TaxID=3076 RepID=A0A2P6TR23_CHLSO|nr:hypothetical protein C2E21_4695 [Chlorella sorokiniana]|eukprot:PRW56507.1 hypothetical protein C2E21_4695 [Chlorella sorokiniana]